MPAPSNEKIRADADRQVRLHSIATSARQASPRNSRMAVIPTGGARHDEVDLVEADKALRGAGEQRREKRWRHCAWLRGERIGADS